MDIQASVSVGHETLRTGEAFDKPHPTPEVLLTLTASSCHQRDDRVHLGTQTAWCRHPPGGCRGGTAADTVEEPRVCRTPAGRIRTSSAMWPVGPAAGPTLTS